jgi:hypothetical protein
MLTLFTLFLLVVPAYTGLTDSDACDLLLTQNYAGVKSACKNGGFTYCTAHMSLASSVGTGFTAPASWTCEGACNKAGLDCEGAWVIDEGAWGGSCPPRITATVASLAPGGTASAACATANSSPKLCRCHNARTRDYHFLDYFVIVTFGAYPCMIFTMLAFSCWHFSHYARRRRHESKVLKQRRSDAKTTKEARRLLKAAEKSRPVKKTKGKAAAESVKDGDIELSVRK